MKPEKVVVVECSYTSNRPKMVTLELADCLTLNSPTGVATLDADAFNIPGLQELLGNIALGNTGATINEFSTMVHLPQTATVLYPTQRAIKTYITSRLVVVQVHLTLTQLLLVLPNYLDKKLLQPSSSINVKAPLNFQGIDGAPWR